jgi:hypothetical protein
MAGETRGMLVHMQRVDARNMDMQYKPEKKGEMSV